MNTLAIVEKMRGLPPEKLIEVEDFIDFLWQREQSAATDHELMTAATKLSEAAFQSVWDNPEDEIYDRL